MDQKGLRDCGESHSRPLPPLLFDQSRVYAALLPCEATFLSRLRAFLILECQSVLKALRQFLHPSLYYVAESFPAFRLAQPDQAAFLALECDHIAALTCGSNPPHGERLPDPSALVQVPL
ncbi:Uncharacterised protein [Vibrio cholerae]|nr:Uncharacterised protein [Vibrio cholerae]